MLASESQIRTACFFYFLLFLNEKRAVRTATESLLSFQRKLLQQRPRKGTEGPLFIECLIQKFKKSKGWRAAGQSLVFAPEDWTLPADLELGPWLQFRKSAGEDEIIAVLLTKVLKFKSADVAAALGLTEGTVRYRTGRGLRQLGTACVPGASA